ncbi:MAG: hypothetical protein JNL82_14585 [Myxococcales bacterium]|nr:hypothetical protein [Myxococcales bacterium]
MDEYLEQEPGLVKLRAETNPDAKAIVEAEAECRRLWEQGLVGWMTIAEGRHVAALLTAHAKQERRDAHADVEPNLAETAGVLVFHGVGRMSLDLACTSPVRAFAHWQHYLRDTDVMPEVKR